MYKLKSKKMKSRNISVKNSADKGESFLLEPPTIRGVNNTHTWEGIKDRGKYIEITHVIGLRPYVVNIKIQPWAKNIPAYNNTKLFSTSEKLEL